MSDSQEYGGSKNPMMVAAWVMLVAAVIWAIIATAMAFKRGGELDLTKRELASIKIKAEQQAIDIQAREAAAAQLSQEAEQVRKTAYEWTRQAQQRIQDIEKQKAAAKQSSTSSAKKSTTSSSKSSSPAKKSSSPTKSSTNKKSTR